MRASSGSTHKRLYGAAWQLARRGFLAANPVCRYCSAAGRLAVATVVDHVVPHKGNLDLFWDQANWQPLCKRCHDAVKQREERGGAGGCDANGNPLDHRSHWHDTDAARASVSQGKGEVETLGAAV